MKNVIAGLSIMILASASVQAQSFSLRVEGGLFRINGDDYNIGAASHVRYVRDNFQYLSGGFDTLKNGATGQVELVFHLGPHWGIGLGTGLFGLEKDGTLEYAYNIYKTTVTYKPKFSAIPVFVNLRYQISVLPKLTLDLFAGAAAYFVKFNLNQDLQSTLNSAFQTIGFKADASAFGFQGGIGLGFEILPNVSLIAEGYFRSAKVKELKGDLTIDSSYGNLPAYQYDGPGYLWYYYEPFGSGYPTIQLSQEKPSEPIYQDVRKAVLNLSGFTAVAGVKFNF